MTISKFFKSKKAKHVQPPLAKAFISVRTECAEENETINEQTLANHVRGPSVSTPPRRRPIAGGDSLGLDEEIFYFTGTPVVSEADEDEPNFSPHSSPSPNTPKPGTSRTNISTQGTSVTRCLWDLDDTDSDDIVATQELLRDNDTKYVMTITENEKSALNDEGGIEQKNLNRRLELTFTDGTPVFLPSGDQSQTDQQQSLPGTQGNDYGLKPITTSSSSSPFPSSMRNRIVAGNDDVIDQCLGNNIHLTVPDDMEATHYLTSWPSPLKLDCEGPSAIEGHRSGGRVVSPGGESENLSSEASTIVAGGGDLSQQMADRIAEHTVESELDEPEPQGEECELDSSELAVLHQRKKPETHGGSQLNEDEARWIDQVDHGQSDLNR